MILEAVTMNIKPELMSRFETVFPQAAALCASTPGYISYELQRCVETKGKYLFLIRWENIDAHLINYKQSPRRAQFHKLMDEFYAGPSEPLHFEPCNEARI